jgi:type I site-specific restriction-modification system R (restriction) subunit
VSFSESVVEDATLAWLESLGYAVRSGPDIVPDESAMERIDFGQMVLEGRLRQMLAWLNPTLPYKTIDDPYQVTLAALRDTLLPKRLSGKIGVRDAERLFVVYA